MERCAAVLAAALRLRAARGSSRAAQERHQPRRVSALAGKSVNAAPSRELQRMRADATKPEQPGSFALGVKWPARTVEELLAEVGDQMDTPATATAALQLVVNNVAAGGLTGDEALQVATTRLAAAPPDRRRKRAAKAAAKPSAAAEELEGDASGRETSDEDDIDDVEGESGSEVQPVRSSKPSAAVLHASKRNKQTSLAFSPVPRADDHAPEDPGEGGVLVLAGRLSAYQAAQNIGDRLEKAPESVHGCGPDTGKSAAEAACCWRTEPACVDSNNDQATLSPCISCRFYFHHKCAIRNGCETNNACGRALAVGRLMGCRA